jgi:hypothetical protein
MSLGIKRQSRLEEHGALSPARSRKLATIGWIASDPTPRKAHYLLACGVLALALLIH